MELLLPFDFEKTCQIVARPGEWLFFLRVGDAGAEGVHLHVTFTDREMPTVFNPQWFTFPVGEGMRLGMRRIDGSEEEVTIWTESVEGQRVMVGLDFPDGITVEPFKDEDTEDGADLR